MTAEEVERDEEEEVEEDKDEEDITGTVAASAAVVPLRFFGRGATVTVAVPLLSTSSRGRPYSNRQCGRTPKSSIVSCERTSAVTVALKSSVWRWPRKKEKMVRTCGV